MKKLLLLLLLVIPMSAKAVLLPDDYFVLFDNGKLVEGAEKYNYIFDCKVPESDPKKGPYYLTFCDYEGNLDKGVNTIYKINGDNIVNYYDWMAKVHPGSSYSHDTMKEHNEYLKSLAEEALIKRQINAVAPDKNDGREDRYFGIDYSSGKVKYIGNVRPNERTEMFSKKSNEKNNLIFVAIALFIVIVFILLNILIKTRRDKKTT